MVARALMWRKRGRLINLPDLCNNNNNNSPLSSGAFLNKQIPIFLVISLESFCGQRGFKRRHVSHRGGRVIVTSRLKGLTVQNNNKRCLRVLSEMWRHLLSKHKQKQGLCKSETPLIDQMVRGNMYHCAEQKGNLWLYYCNFFLVFST